MREAALALAAQEIGLASLGASDADIERLATCALLYMRLSACLTA